MAENDGANTGGGGGIGRAISERFAAEGARVVVAEVDAARIAQQPDLIVCGQAEDIADAMALVKSAQPDLVIVDLSLKWSQ